MHKTLTKAAAKTLMLLALCFLVSAGIAGGQGKPEQKTDTADPQYLVFQFFTDSGGGRAGFSRSKLNDQVTEVIDALESLRGDGKTRQLGFGVGPLSLNLTDDELREVIRESFKLAEEKNIAVLIHIDDSMFWARRSDLWKDPRNVEWTDWQGTVHPRRYVDWTLSAKLAPQMCYNSPTLRKEISRIAREVIGREISQGVDSLKAKNKRHLFAGVIAGWETHLWDYSGSMPQEMTDLMDRDGSPRVRIGYNALSNLGYSAQNPPKDFDQELDKVVQDWAAFWAKELNEAGIPRERIYTHFAGPTWEAFNPYSRPGFSIYTSSQFDGVYPELENQGNPRWACSEGTNLDGQAMGYPWEAYLGRMFNHGASLAAIFAWHEKDRTQYGRATTSQEAIAAYRKFLQGGTLSEKLPGMTSFQKKFRRIQLAMVEQELESRHVSASGQKMTNPKQFFSLVQQMQRYVHEQKMEEAGKIADKILELINSQ